jgi:hypothetical protein
MITSFPKKLDKVVFHKNLKDFIYLFIFFGTNFENTLLIDNMLHKSMFNLPCSAIFFEAFYESPTNGNYLLDIVLPYLESFDLSRMWVYKFVELNPFGSITNLPPSDPHYEKLNAHCSMKCDETICNKVKYKFVNKKRWNILLYC